MCKPSCCNKHGSSGTGFAAIAVVIAGRHRSAVKIGPVVAGIGHIVVESSASPRSASASAVVLAASPGSPSGRRAGSCTVTPAHRGSQPGCPPCTERASPLVPVSEQSCLACGDNGTVVRVIGNSALSQSGHARNASRTAGRVTGHAAGISAQPSQQSLSPSTDAHDHGAPQRRRRPLAVPHRTLTLLVTSALRLGAGPGRHRSSGRSSSSPPRSPPSTVLPWTRQLVIRAGLVRPVPAPHPAGLLRDPDAHPVRAAAPGPAHPPDRSRRTGTDLVPRRDLRRGLRSPRRRDRRRLLRPPGPHRVSPSSGRSSSPSTSCAATPSPRTTSSPPACTTAGLRNGSHLAA